MYFMESPSLNFFFARVCPLFDMQARMQPGRHTTSVSHERPSKTVQHRVANYQLIINLEFILQIKAKKCNPLSLYTLQS